MTPPLLPRIEPQRRYGFMPRMQELRMWTHSRAPYLALHGRRQVRYYRLVRRDFAEVLAALDYGTVVVGSGPGEPFKVESPLVETLSGIEWLNAYSTPPATERKVCPKCDGTGEVWTMQFGPDMDETVRLCDCDRGMVWDA